MKRVYNIGINDLKETEGKSKFYITWNDMLKRCYSEKYQQKHPTYVGCLVCDEWLLFSNFKSWMINQDWEGKCLDKDILFYGNKIYSPQTCVFVRQELNKFLNEKVNDRGLYPIGVYFNKSRNKFMSYCTDNGKQINLGYFDSSEDAHKAWKDKKRQIAKRFAEKQTDARITKALLSRY